MKITVKMKDDTIVICKKCHWSGAIEDGHWMQETEFGYCPKCGSSEFEDLETWEQVEYNCGGVYDREAEVELFGKTFNYTGWKARLIIYVLNQAILAGCFFLSALLVIPWIIGIVKIIKWIF